MHLSAEEVDRYFDIMDALLMYVNERFDVTPDFALYADDPFAEDKAQLIAAELWRNPVVVDDFVKENPAHLSQADLAEAAQWRYALTGSFTLVRYQSGRALFMDDQDIFMVSGLDADLPEVIGRAPAVVHATLLPFADQIIYDGFLKAGDMGLSLERALEDEFERRVSDGIVVDAASFLTKAKERVQKQQEREIEELFAGLEREGRADGEEELPAGFHRGALAALDLEERSATVRAHRAEAGRFGEGSLLQAYRAVALRGPAPASLEEALLRYHREELAAAVHDWGKPLPQPLTKATLVQTLIEALHERRDIFEDALVHIQPGAWELLRQAVPQPGDETVSEPLLMPLSHEQLFGDTIIDPIEPFCFLIVEEDAFSFFVPFEVRVMLAQVDIAAVERRRETLVHALGVADGCVTCCGITTMADAYAQFARLFGEDTHQEEFVALLAREAQMGDLPYEMWHDEATGGDYLIYYTLDQRFVAQQTINGGRQQELAFHLQNTVDGRSPEAVWNRMYDEVRSAVEQDLGRLDDLRAYLIAEHERFPMRPLMPEMAAGNAFDALLSLPATRALRTFLDAHVPDGEDDYTFADAVVREIMVLIIESGHIEAAREYVSELGLFGDGMHPEQLSRLLANLFNNVPSWENNGWTPREVTEKLTGRTIFYDDSGAEMRVGPNDPCPCGSGKPYRLCHGR